MAKHVFRPSEVITHQRKLFIEPPRLRGGEKTPTAVAKAAAEIQELEELGGADEVAYSGPSIADLEREAEEFRQNWEEEKAKLLAEAYADVDRIKKGAEQVAFDEVKKGSNQGKKIRQEAETEAERIAQEAREQASQVVAKAEEKVIQLEKETYSKGYEEGRNSGYQAGEGEVARLVDRLHVVIDTAIQKRNDIIDESESQLISLVLLIAQKVIKVLSDNQKNVVINNVIQALRKLKSRGDVVIRVNLADVDLTTEHTQDFMQMIENVKSITVMEDSTVDKGGCVIETDFGQIDARIASQLNEIEEAILELIPIKTRTGD